MSKLSGLIWYDRASLTLMASRQMALMQLTLALPLSSGLAAAKRKSVS